MSTGDVAVPRPGLEGLGANQRSPYVSVLERLGPKQGWDSFFLLTVAVGVAAWTVREADWVETPGLLAIVFLSSLTGLALAKLRLPWMLSHVVGLSVGSVIVVWQTSSLVPDEPLTGQVREMWNRLGVWYEAVTADGISTDLLPFTLTLLSVAWLLGHVSAWFLFRHGNVWIGLLLSGVAILTNLSFLPLDFDSRFFLFMLPAMLLVARVTMVQRQERWERAGIKFSPGSSWLALSSVAVLSVLVLLLTSFAPLKVYVWQTAVNAWNTGRAPVEQLEEEFARLFSGIAARKGVTGRFFGKTLPFQGKISFGGEVVMWANSLQLTYWLSRTYSRYTPEGWIGGDTNRQNVDRKSIPPPQETLMRTPVDQSVELTFDSNKLFHGGNISRISRDAVAETLRPMSFEIDLKGSFSGSELPEDVRELAEEIAGYNPKFAKYDVSLIEMMLPGDLVLVSPHPDSLEQNTDGPPLVKMTLARKAPVLPDVIAWRFDGRVKKDETYSMRSFVSIATNEDLKAVRAQYSGFITDHYLQLPSDLPQRVRDLAHHLTEDAKTPFDKALAIQDYLRGPTFEYSQDIGKPPIGSDGTDYFLFESRKGYSDYYASAMAVMLRAVGVPTRLAAGYAPGVSEDGSSRRAVRDSDSHGWTQVYFPGHGWIDFEPTPNWADTRDEASGAAQSRSLRTPYASENCFEMVDLDNPGIPVGVLCEYEESETSLGDLQLQTEPTAVESFELEPLAQQSAVGERVAPVLQLLLALGALIGLALFLRLAWTRGMARAALPERIYTKMGRLGRLAGLGRQPQQTPFEYAASLGTAVPGIVGATQTAAIAFSAYRYGRKDSDEPLQETLEEELEYLEELNQAWKRIRSGLVARALGRLVRLGGE